MNVLFSLCCFLAITSYGMAEDNCTDSHHHYHWYPYDCHKYFSCVDGELEILDCPDDMDWNEAIRSCDIKENVDCSDIKPFPDPDCSDGENAYYLYPYDCQKFYECFDGKLYLLTCPDDSLWNDEEKKCDESESVDCSYIIPSTTSSTAAPTSSTSTTAAPTTTTTKATTTSTTTKHTTAQPITTPNYECTYEHQYFPYPYDCSMYYECSNYKAVLMQCPPGEYWDNINQTCDFSYNVECEASTPASIPRK